MDFSARDPADWRPTFGRESMREPSATPPASPAAATVPISAGVFAFLATLPTDSPALPAAEPMEPPTPLSVCVTPLVDCREADEPDLAPRDLLWLDRVFRGERFVLAERLLLDDARALRVGALLGELRVRAGELPLLRVLRRLLVRAGALPLLRDAPAERARGRVFVWAIWTHLPH